VLLSYSFQSRHHLRNLGLDHCASDLSILTICPTLTPCRSFFFSVAAPPSQSRAGPLRERFINTNYMSNPDPVSRSFFFSVAAPPSQSRAGPLRERSINNNPISNPDTVSRSFFYQSRHHLLNLGLDPCATDLSITTLYPTLTSGRSLLSYFSQSRHHLLNLGLTRCGSSSSRSSSSSSTSTGTSISGRGAGEGGWMDGWMDR